MVVEDLMTNSKMIPRQVYWPKVPLAVYREVAAHLRQVDGVSAELLPQTATVFDYELSQAGGLQISWSEDLTTSDRTRILDILDYYRQRFGDWRSPALSED
jgi:hypothetical protein